MTPEPAPRETVAVTITPQPEPSGQDDTQGDTIEPEEEPAVVIPEIELSTPEAVGLGTLSILGLALLILLGMWLGYYLGYKDSDKAEAKFYRALLGK